ncbi:transposon Tf2-9 polyprotein [Trichonephila clavipes]|nr:transposon Tf2-9 polyprotein [Trichonephila clavipes]
MGTKHGTQNVVVDVLSRNPVESIIKEKVNCAIIRDLVLSSGEQIIEEQRKDPELGHIYRYLENPEDSSNNATICENWYRDFGLIEGLLFYVKYATSLGEINPQLWFSTCERTFALGILKAITDTRPKFNCIVSNLPSEAAAIVRDLVITPDETDPYGAIKAQLIQRTFESSQQEIRKLLIGEDLGDRKPSELLRTMNRRGASHNVPKELMLELYLQ